MPPSERRRNIQIHRPIVYGNTSCLITPEERQLNPSIDPTHTHRWTLCVRSAASPELGEGEERNPFTQVGGNDDLGSWIKMVTFKLHDTYANPNRSELFSTFFFSLSTLSLDVEGLKLK
jgi:YEATS domain-containing protein 4